MVQLDGARFATSDLNDLYRRVITATPAEAIVGTRRARRNRRNEEAHAARGSRLAD